MAKKATVKLGDAEQTVDIDNAAHEGDAQFGERGRATVKLTVPKDLSGSQNLEITTDAGALQRLGVNIWERYYGEYTAEAEPMVAAMLHKRVAVRVDVARTRSWDHRKLGMPGLPVAGSTAAYL